MFNETNNLTEHKVIDPFPKWKWMMDFCKDRGISPTIGWNIAEERFKLFDKERNNGLNSINKI